MSISIKDLQEMKKDSAKAEFNENIKDAFVRLIMAIAQLDGTKCIHNDLDKSGIISTFNRSKGMITSKYIAPLKDIISPDTYVYINEVMRDEFNDSIECLDKLYVERRETKKMIGTLVRMFGGEANED